MMIINIDGCLYLTATIMLFLFAGVDPLIVGFGINGNGLDKETRFTYNRDVQIHCFPSEN